VLLFAILRDTVLILENSVSVCVVDATAGMLVAEPGVSL